MNIFYLDKCATKAAQAQCDKHVVKMVLESAQLLSTAHHELGHGHPLVPYKPTHKNHPSALWCRSGVEQYQWLGRHMLALGAEYQQRFNREHLTIAKCRHLAYSLPAGIPMGQWTDPPQCMPDEYKTVDAVEAYRRYYRNGKRHLLTYNHGRRAPEWL